MDCKRRLKVEATVSKRLAKESEEDVTRMDDFQEVDRAHLIHSRIPLQLLEIEDELVARLNTISFPHPVAFVYSPLEYAKELHRTFVKRYCQSTKTVLFLGMNPGPFGMAQTGVPFGDVSMVKDWLQITGNVDKPLLEHPKRQIFGTNCSRNEVSGQRFWSLFKDLCQVPENFFRNAFVYNYCPLMFMKDSAKNVTPNELKSDIQKILAEYCDDALRKVVLLLQTKTIVALGRYAERRAKVALEAVEGIEIRFLMHPSPINPAANRGWNDLAKKQLEEAGLLAFLVS